jgi:gliding motility-associated-like protein
VIGLCFGDSVEIFGNWVTTNGTYSQPEESAQGCQFTHYYTVHIDDCASDSLSLFVPNTFTPNGDLVNDVFTIELLGALLDEGYIYNRWGNAITSFDAEHLTWDGLAPNGEPVTEGVYTYVLFYTPADEIRRTVHGFVTVIR